MSGCRREEGADGLVHVMRHVDILVLEKELEVSFAPGAETCTAESRSEGDKKIAHPVNAPGLAVPLVPGGAAVPCLLQLATE